MDQNAVNVIEKVAAAVGKSGSDVVHYYTTWYIVASIVWCLLGVFIVSVGSKIKGNEDGFIGNTEIPAVVVRWVVIAIGLIFICNNITDLFAPQGIAIHQLIKDLRG